MLPYLLGGGIALAALAVSRHRYRPTPFSLDGPSDWLQSTSILTDLAGPIPDEKNAIWCLSSELAWKLAMQEYFGGPLRLREARPLVDRMNATQANWEGLPPKLLDQRTRLWSPRHFQVFVSLTLNVPFGLPFYQMEGPLAFNRYDAVKGFGIPPGRSAPAGLRQQVQVLYSGPREFIVDPCHTSRPFQLVLAAVKKRETLEQTIQASENHCAGSNPRALPAHASLLIPEQSWCLSHHVAELSGIFTTETQDLQLRMDQGIQFRLDRCGARLFSAVNLSMFLLSARTEFHFNYPFLLYIKARHNGQILFAQWIENSELLVPY